MGRLIPKLRPKRSFFPREFLSGNITACTEYPDINNI